MKSDKELLISVPRAAMGFPKTSTPVLRIEGESAGAPPEMADAEQIPVVAGVSYGAFAWS